MKVLIRFGNNVKIPLNHLEIMVRDLKELSMQGPTENVKDSMKLLDCRKVSYRDIYILGNETKNNKFDWLYSIKEWGYEGDTKQLHILGFSKYVPKTLKKPKK